MELTSRHLSIAAVLMRTGPILCCGHGAALDEQVFICGLHPETGLRCLGCAVEHTRIGMGHDYEHVPCDWCGAATGSSADMQPGHVDLLEPIVLHGPEDYHGSMSDRRLVIMPDEILCRSCGLRAGSRAGLN